LKYDHIAHQNNVWFSLYAYFKRINAIKYQTHPERDTAETYVDLHIPTHTYTGRPTCFNTRRVPALLNARKSEYYSCVKDTQPADLHIAAKTGSSVRPSLFGRPL